MPSLCFLFGPPAVGRRTEWRSDHARARHRRHAGRDGVPGAWRHGRGSDRDRGGNDNTRRCGRLDLVPSGSKAKAGILLLAAKGAVAALRQAWKATQTLTEILSGIATATRALVDAVEAFDPNVRVACTRNRAGRRSFPSPPFGQRRGASQARPSEPFSSSPSIAISTRCQLVGDRGLACAGKRRKRSLPSKLRRWLKRGMRSRRGLTSFSLRK